MPYVTRIAAALSGATISQLGHWRRTGLFVPEASVRSKILYSFRDVVALRTFAYLRSEVSLQKIRAAVQGLRLRGESEHLSKYRLTAVGGDVFLIEEDEDTNLNRRQGLLVRLIDVAREFEVNGRKVLDLQNPYPEVTLNPGVLSGFPVVRGTRVPFDVVAGLVEDGATAEDVAYFYPTVSADGTRDAVRFAHYVAGAAA